MKIIFAGTPEFARVALEHLHRAGHEIALVLTQPDRPAGRGMKLQASAVKQFAVAHGIPVAQPHSLRLDGKFPEEAAAALTSASTSGSTSAPNSSTAWARSQVWVSDSHFQNSIGKT